MEVIPLTLFYLIKPLQKKKKTLKNHQMSIQIYKLCTTTFVYSPNPRVACH
jgi:hypothetical protein